jgi:hypothetical protein
MIVDPETHCTPRSSPVRAATAKKILLNDALACACTTSIGRSPGGRSLSGQLVGAQMMSAPRSAADRTHSGNSRS